MPVNPLNPMVVQSDRSVLLEVDNALYGEARDALARFAELEKSPEHIHTYRLSPLSLWNAAASGLTADSILTSLTQYSKYDVPGNIQADVRDYISRFGRIKLRKDATGGLLLSAEDPLLMLEVSRQRKVKQFILEEIDATTVRVNPAMRGHVKKALVDVGYPAEDLAGYVDGAGLTFELLPARRATGEVFGLRHYQQDAADTFHADGSAQGGSGVIVLPCGAGKTMVGMGAMSRLQTNTLIMTTNTVAVRQWMDELLDKTTLTPDDIGEYTGDTKEIRPVTVTTYQILTYHTRRRGRDGDPDDLGWDDSSTPKPLSIEDFPHFRLFNERDWGLIVYDEVHLLPAPVFRMTAELQGRRRLGLTATLVREDGCEEDVFALIGPKKYDVPWKDLERQGWIATAHCHEVRLSMSRERRMEYALAESKMQYPIAATDPDKLNVVEESDRQASRRPGARHRHLSGAVARGGSAPERAAAHRQDPGARAPEALSADARRHAAPAGRLEGRQLRHRPAGCQRRHRDQRHLRLSPGGGAAAGPHPAPEKRWPARALLRHRHARHQGSALRRPSPDVPHRAGVQVRDPVRG